MYQVTSLNVVSGQDSELCANIHVFLVTVTLSPTVTHVLASHRFFMVSSYFTIYDVCPI